jgi:predicted secreted protein
MENREFAERHWIGLDNTLRRILTNTDVALARERFARRVAALSEIYVPRLSAQRGQAHTGDAGRELVELQHTHHALVAALLVAWNEDDEVPDRD